jgi:hypothetical protein
MGSTETQMRSSEDRQRSDQHVRTRLLIRRFGVRIPGGPPATPQVDCLFGVACQARPRPTDPQQTLRCARFIRDRPRPVSLRMTVVRGRWLAVPGLMIGAADRPEHSRERWSDDHHTHQPATSRVRSRTSSAAFRTPSRPPFRVPHTLRQLHDFTVPRRCRGVSAISPQRDPLRRGAESQDG